MKTHEWPGIMRAMVSSSDLFEWTFSCFQVVFFPVFPSPETDGLVILRRIRHPPMSGLICCTLFGKVGTKNRLVGGLEHFLFSHILGIIIPIDSCFSERWPNHQPANHEWPSTWQIKHSATTVDGSPCFYCADLVSKSQRGCFEESQRAIYVAM